MQGEQAPRPIQAWTVIYPGADTPNPRAVFATREEAECFAGARVVAAVVAEVVMALKEAQPCPNPP